MPEPDRSKGAISMNSIRRHFTVALCLFGIAVFGFVAVTASRARAQEPAPQPGAEIVAAEVQALAKVIQYQGRLLNPATSTPKSDGNYAMGFRIYTVPSGANPPLWSENQTVPVAQGNFSVLLGSVTPFPATLFNGQSLYLGVSVGAEPELAGRVRISPVAYALFSDNADLLDGKDSTSFALDTEVMPIILASGGSGSGIDADTVDGWDQSSLVKGFTGVQVNQTAALAPGASEYWFTFGYSPSNTVIWTAIPMVASGKLKLTVETERGNDGNITYWLLVQNTGPISTPYQLVRHTIYQ